ncbi:MAG: DNA polymerase IV [Rhizobiales bacterium]|nr:DNA polymerase IV [Hyphomicrobiales bacterium]
MPRFCRDCLTRLQDDVTRCTACGSPRVLAHAALDMLSIAHVDCDAFYATVEKRDDPSLADKPLIVGGGKRGVVATACYIARSYGIRSAMPMFKALQLCPGATVIRPNMAKYVEVGRKVRGLMQDLTPLVEPLSIDEAFLDLTGTARLHNASPAESLARFARRVETELGISVSIGLSANKFLAKIASDLDKPRGFTILAPEDAPAFLAPRPISFIWGIGKVTAQRFERDGFRLIADLQRASEVDLMRRYGPEGQRLWRLARGMDARRVTPDREAKVVSSETTFDRDIAELRPLEKRLWSLCEKVSARLKAHSIAGTTITLKLKTSEFRLRTRALSLDGPTALADRIFAAGRLLLAREIDGTHYRLIGIGVSSLCSQDNADAPDLVEARIARSGAAERAMDKVRERFGRDALMRGITFEPESER